MAVECDVLVVGAGPAGSMAAKTASEKGLKVLLIEKNPSIGEPVRCGEGINKFLFKDTGIKKDNSFIRQKINGTKIYFYDEVYHLNDAEWQGYIIDRKVFDKYLAKLATNAGAEIFVKTRLVDLKWLGDEWTATVESNTVVRDIKSKIVIGADGFSSTVARLTGLQKSLKKRLFAKGFGYEISGLNLEDPDIFHIAFGEEFPLGYGWIFPFGKDTANVGVGVGAEVNAKKAFNFFMNEYPGIKEIFEKGYHLNELKGGVIPMSGPKKVDEIVSDGLLLVGDAAGMVDPITGEGITPSMLSGIAAGEAVAIALNKGTWKKDQLKRYDQIWREKMYCGHYKLGEDMEFLKEIQEIFYQTFTNRNISKETREKILSATKETTEYGREILAKLSLRCR